MTLPIPTVMLMTMAATAQPASERSAILDAARAPVVTRIGKPVLFKVNRLARDGDWAFLQADMQDSGGKPVDYAGTPLADAWDNGAVSKSCVVLLQKRDGRWAVIDSRVGPTDVAWAGWASEHRAPPSLFR